MRPLISDAARPMKRTLHLETLKLLDHERAQFDLLIPGPAVLRSAIARSFQVKKHVIGAEAETGVALVLTFEIDPDAEPVPRRYYALPYGITIEGAHLAELLFETMATLPNGAPVAIYSLPPPELPKTNGTNLSVERLQQLSRNLEHTRECRAQPDGMNCICRGRQ